MTTGSDVVDNTDGLISLREAIEYAKADPSLGDAITFAPNVKTLEVTGNRFLIDAPIKIGDDNTDVTVDYSSGGALFRVESDVVFNGVSIVGAGWDAPGDAVTIDSDGVTVTFKNATIKNVMGSGKGAAFTVAANATLNIENASIVGNIASDGTAVAMTNGGRLNLTDVVVSENYPGSVVYANNAEITANRVRIVNNDSFRNATFDLRGSSTAVVANSLVADNVGPVFKINDVANLCLVNVTVANNGGVAIVPATGATFNVCNSIFYNNALVSDGDYELQTAPNIEFSIVDADSYATLVSKGFAGNGIVAYKETDDLFTDAKNGDYSLPTTSIAINAGENDWNAWAQEAGAQITVDMAKDLVGATRVNRGVVDLGAYEIQLETPSIIVTTAEDVVDPLDNKISLREAIQVYFGYETRDFDANVDPDGQTITFDLTDKTISLDRRILISTSMKIYGGDVPTITLDGQNAAQIFLINGSAGKVEIEGITFANGKSDDGGAISAFGANVTIKNSTFTNNYAGRGGAIYFSGETLRLEDVTLQNNGGVIASTILMSGGTLYGNRLNVVGNVAKYGVHELDGGIISLVSDATAVFTNSLFTDNQARGLFSSLFDADAIYLVNDTIANNDVQALIDRSIYSEDDKNTFNVYNTILYNTGLGYRANLVTNVKNTVLDYADYEALETAGVDVSTLTDNSSGVLFTDAANGDYSLPADSVAVNKGANAWTTAEILESVDFTVDLADNPRFSQTIDAGAYEAQLETASIIVTTAEDVVDPTDGLISLREAITKYFAQETREFDANVDPTGRTITFDLSEDTITLTQRRIIVKQSMKIYGGDAPTITIDANNASQIFYISRLASEVEIEGIVFANGYADDGAAIGANGANVTVKNSVFMNNDGYRGGAINASNGTFRLEDSFVQNNKGRIGSAILVEGGSFYGNRIKVVRNETEYSLNTVEGGVVTLAEDATAIVTNSLFVGNVGKSLFHSLYRNDAFRLINDTIANNDVQALIDRSDDSEDSTNTFKVYNAILYNTGLGDRADLVTDVKNVVLDDADYQAFVNAGKDVSTLTSNSQISLFTDAANGDYTLVSSSAAANVGDNAWTTDEISESVDFTVDLAGNPRIYGDRVDLGAYELQTEVTEPETPSIIVTTTEDVVDPTDGLISLREAVEVYFGFTSRTFDATVDSTGQTITFDLAEPGDVVLENGEITISDSMAIYGGDLAAITIEGNLASRIFKVADGVATVDFQGLTFRHGLAFTGDYASGDAYDAEKEAFGGGAIYATTAAITVKRSEFIGNAGYVGGAIFVDGGTLSLDGATFIGNVSAYEGGAVALFATEGVNTASLVVSGTSFETNASDRSGAVYFKDGVATVAGSEFVQNLATYASGGAITASNSTMSLTDVAFVSNKSERFGGAIFAANSAIAINNGDGIAIDGNSAHYGGAIYASNDDVVVEAGSFTNNTATESGGAIFASGTLAVSGVFDGNEASKHGGAIYASATVDATDATFTSNAASGAGGAIYAISDLNVESAIFESNASVGSGCAIYATKSAVTVVDAAFKQNESALSGGAIRIAKATSATFDNATFEGNFATGAGGAIDVSATPNVTIAGGAFDDNSATNSGGAIYAASSKIDVTDAEFYVNSSQKFGGAVALVDGSDFTIVGGSIKNGGAMAGGAIYVVAATAEIESAEFSYNVAKTGCAIYAGDNLTVSDATFRGNTASEIGGAAYVKSSEVSFEGVVFEENSTETNGGALYLHTTTAAITECEFAGNTSVDRGGAIIMIDGELTVSSSSFVRNASDNIGGAIYQLRGTSTISDVSFNANEAKAWGGALYLGAGASTISGSTFTDNEASRGTAISSMAATSLEIDGEAFPATGAINDEDLSAALLDEAFAELFVEELD